MHGRVYADNGMIGPRYPAWIQGYINVVIELFIRVGLMDSVEKSKTVTFQSGTIHTGILEEAFSQDIKGEGATLRKVPQQRIPLTDYRVELTSVCMTAHCRQLHMLEPAINWDQIPVR